MSGDLKQLSKQIAFDILLSILNYQLFTCYYVICLILVKNYYTNNMTHLDGGFSAKNLRISDGAQPERFPTAGGRSPLSDHSPVAFDGGKA